MRIRPVLDGGHFRDKGIEWWRREDRSPHDSFVFDILRNESIQNVLEIGPGRGAFTFRMKNMNKQVVAIEINPDFIKYCRKKGDFSGIEFLQGNAEALPFRDRTFDAVVCIEVLMHLPHPDRAFKEISRVTKTGGTAIVSFLRKYSRHHVKRMFTVLTGIYAKRYGRDAFDYRFDTLADLQKYAQGTSLVVTNANGKESSNPCVMLEKVERA